MFRVVETNDFNQLPHITLAFRQGNDAAVKSFLAGRLSEVRASHTTLERDLSRAQVWQSPSDGQIAPAAASCEVGVHVKDLSYTRVSSKRHSICHSAESSSRRPTCQSQ